jgi:peptidoglycan/xylan/chitin deacetylase (PgdA/CDA1 family)
LKKLVRFLFLTPLGRPLAALAGGGATCLMYHHLAPGPARREARFQPNLELFVAEEEFEKQVAWLARNHDCLAVGEAVALLKAGKLPRRAAIVTFDDGYRDNLLAVPILRRHRVPATIYITTGAIARARTFWWDEHEAILAAVAQLELTWQGTPHRWELGTRELKERAFRDLNRMFKALPPAGQDELLIVLRSAAQTAGLPPPYFDADAMLTWEEVTALDREPLITIGAHTVDHFVMSQLRDEELQRQIHESRDELQRRLGHPVQHFAYPFGREEHAGLREFAAVERAGFVSAVTTRPAHWRGDVLLHALPRLAVDYSDTMEDFRWKLSGFAAALQRRATKRARSAGGAVSAAPPPSLTQRRVSARR